MNPQTRSVTHRFGFIGAGKLAGSVIRGLLRANFCGASDILASEQSQEMRDALERDLGISTTPGNAELASRSETIFLGLKPQVVLPVLGEIAEASGTKLIVSFAAGIRLGDMEAASPARFMRVMTNTPSAICRAATGIAGGSRSTKDDAARLQQMFSALGTAVEISEDEIDAVTALAGSGPAFVYTVIEALARGGTAAGLRSAHALQLAAQMTLGAAELALNSGKTPEELREMVVTPGGTTAAGLAVIAERGAAEALAAAVEAAAARGAEMSRSLGR